MRVSQRLDYTLRGLTALAELEAGACVPAGDIADRLGLPRRFVEQQFTALARAALVECRRGAGGGCSLARPASEITIGEIVRALQGTALDVPRISGSAVSELWASAAATLDGALDAVTLGEVAARQRELDAQVAPMYYI
jgi:Rrf2 family iron-sulfur cluster assembly transcriptional regulator